MSDAVYKAIMQVRSSGACNMLDIPAVTRYAYEHDMFELVVFLTECKKEYVNFIFTGQR